MKQYKKTIYKISKTKPSTKYKQNTHRTNKQNKQKNIFNEQNE